ncbi:MAG: UDP-N-acetylmuramate--L-alanine ligase [Gammaproteobacteria bacterium]
MPDISTLPMHQVERIHFVGIGGAGMSGIAEVFRNLGYRVTGSDLAKNRMTEHLESIGVGVVFEHAAANIVDADVVVYSSAVNDQNPELIAAREARIPIVPRAEMLVELMRFRRGIAVAGTHGKTTTTSLIASVMAEGGLDPTFVIGGLVHSVNSHARLGSGNYLVCEADESDASFLLLNPLMAVLTNIDADHMDTYGGDFEKLRDSFVTFFRRLPFYGVAIVCLDDPNIATILPEIRARVLTYGMHADADVRAVNIVPDGQRCRFEVEIRENKKSFPVTLNMPGHHNVQNCLAAIAVATELGLREDAVARALMTFQGVSRRCQYRGDAILAGKRVTVIDDYGHHPREISATCEAVRGGWPGRRLIVAFQPHRYTRTRDLFEDFVETLSAADALVILEIYSAGEEVIPGADSRALCRAIRARGKIEPVFAPAHDEMVEILCDITQPDDVILVLGAGNIGRLIERFEFDSQSAIASERGGAA